MSKSLNKYNFRITVLLEQRKYDKKIIDYIFKYIGNDILKELIEKKVYDKYKWASKRKIYRINLPHIDRKIKRVDVVYFDDEKEKVISYSAIQNLTNPSDESLYYIRNDTALLEGNSTATILKDLKQSLTDINSMKNNSSSSESDDEEKNRNENKNNS